MHDTAMQNAQKFKSKYVKTLSNLHVVDIGSYNVNGTLRSIFQGARYTGIDQSAGPNVDIVCNADTLPFDNNSIDIVVSSSCFEHDPTFWETFLEMCRIVKPGGYIYINAPSSGPYHGYPGDSWRFYKDSWSSLAQWSTKKGHNIKLLESYVDSQGVWKDSVGIFQKQVS
jgi:ubiquinone/menaquinone biosynthesis C-methylase UbiE